MLRVRLYHAAARTSLDRLDHQHDSSEESAPDHEVQGPFHPPPNARPRIGRVSPHEILPVIAAPKTAIPMPIWTNWIGDRPMRDFPSSFVMRLSWCFSVDLISPKSCAC